MFVNTRQVHERCHQRVARGMDGGKLPKVNARTEPRRQYKLVGKFKMAAGDMVSIKWQVME